MNQGAEQRDAGPGFTLREVGFAYGPARVLEDVTLTFAPPGVVAITGPNGAGKSTLLGILAGLRSHYEGDCRFRGVPVRQWQRHRFARRVSFVPQSLSLEFPFTAEQVVMMGRTPYCDGLFEGPDDWRVVEESMRLTDTLPFRHRDFRSLSGGERQRVVLASALAQQPEVMLLDEPTTFLDLEHQLAICNILRQLSRQGMLIISATHDLNLAAVFSDRMVVLHRGCVAADAAPESVLTPALLKEVFRVDARVDRGAGGRPRVFYGD